MMRHLCFLVIVLVAFFLDCSLDAIIISPFLHEPSLASKAEAEYQALKSFDEQIDKVVQRQQEQVSLSGQIALSILYHIRDEHWKQGGDWQAWSHIKQAWRLYQDNVLRDPQEENFSLEYAIHIHHSRILSNIGQYEDALRVLEEVQADITEVQSSQRHHQLFYRKELSTVLYMKGDVYLSQGMVEESIPYFVQSLELNLCQHQAYYKLAVALVSHPNKTVSTNYELKQQLRQQSKLALSRVTLKERNQIVFRNNATSTKPVCQYFDHSDGFDILQEHSDMMEVDSSLVIETRTSPENKQRVIQSTFYWALHLLADHEKDYHSAWNYLQQARFQDRFRLAESSVYSLENTVKAAEHIKSFFTSEYWPTKPSDWMGSGSKAPVFIVGFFRSGSTLLETLLDSHDSVWGMGENSPFTFQMHELQHAMLGIANNTQSTSSTSSSSSKSGNTEEEMSYVNEFTKLIKQHANVILKKMKQRFKDYHPEFYNTVYRQEHDLTENPTTPEVPITRIVDKMLLNYRNIALIHLVFPNAVILHMVRDPLDCLLSCLKHRFGDFSPYTLEYRSLILEYVAYLEIIHHFRSHLPFVDFTSARGDKKALRRQAIIDVRYEQLVAEPERVLAQIFDLLDVDPPANMTSFWMDFHQKQRHVRTASYLQVKQPISTNAIGQWKKYASQLQQNLIPELKIHIKALREMQALPFDDKESKTTMNWDLKFDFNYTTYLENLRFNPQSDRMNKSETEEDKSNESNSTKEEL